MRLKDKVAFISGGARGIGAAIAKLFAMEGAKVVIGDVLEEEGRKTETEINETGGESLFLRMDVTSEDEWQQAVASTLARFGKLDVLVNNAGIGDTGKVEDTTVEAWDRVMDVNAKGVFLGTKAAIPELRRSGSGSIINISSQVGLVGTETASPQYQASKGAVRMLTKATAIQYADDRIRVNSVHPGPIITPMLEASDDGEMDKILLSRIPLKKYGEPDNVAFAVLLLASDESCFMTGSEMVIDGGYTAW
jgi:NAD(P)-dependent dehydrogenase (short-subunit alcohol dehydrogenase family)|tara:strand:+ start:514 stop:1263 length:750 start_codon:yes stop_codon:yes gene_type:complete